MDQAEIKIPVPWGFIAAKVYGQENNEAIFCLHGRQDNAGSFDRLIPLLPNCFYYISIDLPSHGKSTPLPQGMPIFTMTFVAVLKMIAEYLERDQFIILGHSYGAGIGFRFAQFYPNRVKKLIMVEMIHHLPVTADMFKKTLVDAFDALPPLKEKHAVKRMPPFTYEEALTIIMRRRFHGCLNEEAAKPLLERSTVPDGNGKFIFIFDQRMKYLINPLHDMRFAVELVNKYPINCPLLLIAGNETVKLKEYLMPLLREISKYPKCVIIDVVGGHDVHNNSPMVVAPHVSKFLLNNISKI